MNGRRNYGPGRRKRGLAFGHGVHRCVGSALARLDLKPADVDLDRGTVRIFAGKGDHNRTVAIDDSAVAVFQLWLAERARLGMSRR